MLQKAYAEENNCFVKEPSYPQIMTLASDAPWRKVKAYNQGKILVVDDEKFNCDIVYGFLMIFGVRNRSKITEFAYNGEEALSRIQQAVYNNDPFKY